MKRSDWRGRACAAVIGALVGFGGGLSIAGQEAPPNAPTERQSKNRPAGEDRFRNPYSPQFSKDPYVLREQERVVEALEAECRNSRTHCSEAEQARRWMSERDASD